MTPKIQTPFVPPAVPLPTRDTAQQTENDTNRLKYRQGMAATELSAGAGLQQQQAAGMSATKKLMGQAV